MRGSLKSKAHAERAKMEGIFRIRERVSPRWLTLDKSRNDVFNWLMGGRERKTLRQQRWAKIVYKRRRLEVVE